MIAPPEPPAATAEQLPAAVPPTWPAPGLHPDIPAATYHELDALNASTLRKLRTSTPAHLRDEQLHPRPRSTVLDLGHGIHAAVLEPDIFARDYVQAHRCTAAMGSGQNKGERCTAMGRTLTKDGRWLCGTHDKGVPAAERDPRTVLSWDDYEACKRVRDRVWTDPELRKWVDVPEQDREVSAVWEREDLYGNAVLCKARADVLNDALGAVVDVKSTRSAHPQEFARQARDKGYHMAGEWYQDGLYRLGLLYPRFILIAAEKTGPCEVAVYEPSVRAMDTARHLCDEAFRLYTECRHTGVWPGYGSHVQLLDLPHWDPEALAAEEAAALAQ